MCTKRADFRWMPPRHSSHTLAALLCLAPLLLFAQQGSGRARVQAASPAGPHRDVFELSIEELMDIEVSLVSRKAESVRSAPAAIHVVTQEDIRQSGATTIADALRLVPGLQVARMEANKWAIAARGFDGRFARHMLVLIDGRTAYTPLFSGVFWEIQDFVLEDIERIEVIRGPGGAMWGANAVNGVVNVVTKRAADTQGGLLVLGAGTEERGTGSIRYGGVVGEDAHYRVYAKGFERDAGGLADNEEGDDNWRMRRGGFRLDWDVTARDSLTLCGDYYDGDIGQRVFVPNFLAPPTFTTDMTEDVDVSGGNVLLRWERLLQEESDLALQLYYDRTERSELTVGEKRNTFDIDFQHRFPWAETHDLMWGVGYRFTTDDLRESQTLTLQRDKQDDHLVTAFVQDEIALIPERLSLTLGTKIEHNDYTGTEIQPTARLSYRPTPRQTLWAAVSRAVRTPSRVEQTMLLQAVLPAVPPIPITMRGDDSYDSENVIAYEMGYRVQAAKSLVLDFAAFYNDYSDLQSVEPQGLVPPIPFVLDNNIYGEAYGIETAAQWQVRPWWRVKASHTFMRLILHERGRSNDVFTQENFEDDLPQNQASVLSTMQLPGNLEFSAWLRYVNQAVDVDKYLEVDASLTWHAAENVQLTLVCQNLREHGTSEYASSMILKTQPTETERRIYAMLRCTF